MGNAQVTYRFGPWLVEPYLNRLSKNDVGRQLEPRTMDVLECLLARAGEVVATDELLDRVWAGRYAEPHMVAKRISQIRRALGDDAKDPKFIATVSKRGYRTIGPVDLIENQNEVTSTNFLAELEAQTPPFPAYDGDGPFVFVCYAHTDRAAIYPELLQLRDAGINVWYDEGITPGSEWSEELANAIDGCVWFLYYVSPGSVASDHCRAEAQFAVRRGKALLTVHLEHTVLPDGLDLLINAKQALHKYGIAYEDYRRKLLSTLTEAPAVQPVTKSSAAVPVPRAPNRRYRPAVTVGALIVVLGILSWISLTLIGQRPGNQIPSIAVLPLDNLSGDPAQQYVADGMTEEIITELGKLRQLRVISRTSVMRYKTDRPSMREIAKDLGVDTIIEGSVAREAGRFRVTIQLIDALTDSHIWAHSFDRDVSTVLALRSEVAGEIASQLNLDLSSDEQVALQVSRTIDEAAYDAYLRALSEIRETQQFADWAPRAIEQLARAAALDPNFAEAWALLALIKTIEAVFVSRDHFVTVREYAEKALSIDSRVATAHTALGYVRLLNDWDPLGAEPAFKRALQLSPNDPRVLQGYMINLRTQERTEEALQISEQLIRSSPLDFHQRAERAVDLYGARLYERVLKEAEGVRALESSFHSFGEAAAYHRLGRFEDSHRARIAAFRRCGVACDRVRTAADRGRAEGGYESALRALLEQQFQESSTRRLYWVHAQLGELDAAFARLERQVESRAPWLVGIRYHPDFDALRLDPRFDALLERMNLPTLTESPARMADVGRLMAFRGRAGEAIERLNRAMTASPEDPRLPRWLEAMAWAQFAAMDYSQAVDWAERALEHDIGRHAAAFAHLLLASSYVHLGQMDAARAALQDAQKFWPSTLRVDRDLLPFFLGGDQDMRDRYIAGLRKAGLET